MPGNGSRHTGKSSGSNRVNVENNGSKVGEHRLCKLWKPALRKRTVSSIKIGRSQCFSLLPYFNWNILYDYIGKDTLFSLRKSSFARFSFLNQLIPKSVLLVIIGAQLFDHFSGSLGAAAWRMAIFPVLSIMTKQGILSICRSFPNSVYSDFPNFSFTNK